MLNGTIFDVLSDYVEDPRSVDFRRFLTVDRDTLVRHLDAHPEIAEAYLKHQSAIEAFHDVAIITPNESGYVVAWLDHGQQKWPRGFKSLNAAVAEHVLVSHGMY